MTRRMQIICFTILCFSLMTAPYISTLGSDNNEQSMKSGRWIDKPQDEWPQIAMVNQIEYTDKSHPIAGCSFLLDTGKDILAVTAKHVLTYFKSQKMDSVSFKETLLSWKMFPKNNPADVVIVDQLLNEDPHESIEKIPSENDWLLFTIKERSNNIKPLKFRTEPLKEGEKVYIVGWRYSDKDCPQRIYEGNFVRAEIGSVIISTKELTHNKMPGLSGAPVIDSKGDLIGLMSRKQGELERVAGIDYPKRIIKKWKK